MSISGIAGIGGALGTNPLAMRAASVIEPMAEEDGFGSKLAGAINNLDTLHKNADALALQAATGDLTDVHEYTIAATEAQLATELTVAVRDKAVAAFNEIMRMPV